MDKFLISEFEMPGYQCAEKLYESRQVLVCRVKKMLKRESVILKILKPGAVAKKNEVARLKHEFEILSKLNIPGVVKSDVLEETRGSVIMVLRDIGGRSLDRLQMPLSLEEFFEIATALSDTVGLIHKQHIIHKNINPSNIVWNPQTKQLNLIDFGIAEEIPARAVSVHAQSAIEGTLEYISPEQTGRMNRVVDYRTDFYSLGVTYYQMLLKKLPFVASDALGILHLHIAGTAQKPHELKSDIPEMVSRIVMKLIEKMADDRYQSAWGVEADLERCFHEFKNKGVIEQFTIGENDFSDQLQIPQKMYGREKELNQLLEAFDRVSRGGCELLFVNGYAGVGKTTFTMSGHSLTVFLDDLQWIDTVSFNLNDPIVRNRRIKSLLCAPMSSRGKLVSILYLENNLTTHAFTPERVKFLDVPLYQIATLAEGFQEKAIKVLVEKYWKRAA